MEGLWKRVLSALTAMGVFLFGGVDGLLISLIVLIVLDYVTGVIAAALRHELSSEVGARGIAKKVFMLAIVAVANIVDVCVVGDGHVLRTVVVIFYISNEGISLLENGGRMGVPLPDKLLQVLKQLKDNSSNTK